MSTTTTAITITKAAADSAGLNELVNELSENVENQYEKPAAAPSLCARVCLCACACAVCIPSVLLPMLCAIHTCIKYLHAYACVLLYVPNSEQPPV